MSYIYHRKERCLPEIIADKPKIFHLTLLKSPPTAAVGPYQTK